jgi:hypothetical protein
VGALLRTAYLFPKACFHRRKKVCLRRSCGQASKNSLVGICQHTPTLTPVQVCCSKGVTRTSLLSPNPTSILSPNKICSTLSVVLLSTPLHNVPAPTPHPQSPLVPRSPARCCECGPKRHAVDTVTSQTHQHTILCPLTQTSPNCVARTHIMCAFSPPPPTPHLHPVLVPCSPASWCECGPGWHAAAVDTVMGQTHQHTILCPLTHSSPNCVPQPTS